MQCFQTVSSSIAQQQAIRGKQHPLLMAARKQLNQFRFARGHTAYDSGCVRDIAARLQLHPTALQCIQELELLSASADAAQYRPIDDWGETLIKALKREPRRSDKDLHWDVAARTLAKQLNLSAGTQREAIDAFFGMKTRARRARTQEPVEETIQSFASALRQGSAFASRDRTVWEDLQCRPLASTAEQLFTVGTQRMQAFVNERYVHQTVAPSSARSTNDTRPVQVASASEAQSSKHSAKGAQKVDSTTKNAHDAPADNTDEDDLYDPNADETSDSETMTVASSVAATRDRRKAFAVARNGIAAVSVTEDESSDYERSDS